MSIIKSVSKKMKGYNYLAIFLLLLLVALILYCVFYLIDKKQIELFNTKVVLEIYTAPWCGFCKQFESGDKINKIKQNIGSENVKHYIDGDPECAKNMQKYNLGGYPSIILTRNGEVVNKYSGPREVEPICSFYNSNK